MGKGTKLSPYEQGRIDSLREEGLSMRAIAHRITRSYKAVNSYLKDSSAYARKNPGGRPPKLSAAAGRSVASRPGALWACFPARLSPESGSVRKNGTPLCRVGAMALFSITQYKEGVFSSNSQE